MKTAASFDSENKLSHFGHAEAFKVFEIEDGKIVSSETVKTEGSGHGYMVGLMKELGVEAVLCGRIGGHALEGLTEAGIPVYLAANTDVDEAAEAYLKGELTQADGLDSACGGDHDEPQEEAGCGGCGGGSGCGGCGGCGEPTIRYEGKNAGKTVRAHYRGTLDDGSQFDSSYDRGEPLEFICGVGQMIPGFDKAVVDMEAGQIVDVHIPAEEAYGPQDPNAILHFAIADLPGSEDLTVGQAVYLSDQYGRPIRVKVTEKDETNITLDANHELAGQALNFRIELVEVRE